MDPKGRFRDSYYYNDLMYGIIAKITEDISGRPWEEMVSSEILAPLGMTSTNFFTTFNPLIHDVARGYVEDRGSMYPVQYDFLRYFAYSLIIFNGISFWYFLCKIETTIIIA